MRLEGALPTRRLVSLTPLIDVVFILLMFFMLATRFEHWQRLPLDTAEAGPGHGPQGAVLLRLLDGDRMDLGGLPLDPAELPDTIAGRLERAAELRVLVQAGAGVPLQRAIFVLDMLDEAGVRDATLLAAPGATLGEGRP